MVGRWFQESPSEYAWEREGLDHLRRLLPDAGPYAAWATFSFTAVSGRINECDLFVAAPGGLYLVELKAHLGHVTNRGATWVFRKDGGGKRALRNPLHQVDRKAKELKILLDRAARDLRVTTPVPRIEPAVFLSAAGLRSELDEVQRTNVYGRDDDSTGLPWIWRDLLSLPGSLSEEFAARTLPRLMRQIGVEASTAHLRFGDDWVLDPRPLDTGPGWEDRLARRGTPVREVGRLRVYFAAAHAGAQARQDVERAARREYQVLRGVVHRGIAQAAQFGEHRGGHAILFRHHEADLRLDTWLDLHPAAGQARRLDLVRQLAEALRYAHSHSLHHRALAARSVHVSDEAVPVLRVIDWQTAARSAEVSGLTSLTPTVLDGKPWADGVRPYLAPEFDLPDADPVALDVFGLGALAHLLLTGEPPAPDRDGLLARLMADGGLRVPGAVPALEDLVHHATRADVVDRLDSVPAFLERLDAVTRTAASTMAADPLTAAPGQVVDRDWVVERVLGTGSTAQALLVGHGTDRRVFKIALDEERAQRLRAEAAILRVVGGGMVVRLLDGPRVLGGRTTLDLEFAGETALSARLRTEGRLDRRELERYGGDVLRALDQLAAKGVRHRDVKPDNFGMFRRADGASQLLLFDFSLADAPDLDTTAGTRLYADPFLGTAARPHYDDHAEWYAAAVTLHEMASGARPVWGDGLTDPRMTADQVPTIAVDLFEPALRDGLTAFFGRALHREAAHRFADLRDLTRAWQRVFTAPESAEPVVVAPPVEVTPTTALAASGLSPRAVVVTRELGLATAADLATAPLHVLTRRAAIGTRVRRELKHAHRAWADPEPRPVIVAPPRARRRIRIRRRTARVGVTSVVMAVALVLALTADQGQHGTAAPPPGAPRTTTPTGTSTTSRPAPAAPAAPGAIDLTTRLTVAASLPKGFRFGYTAVTATNTTATVREVTPSGTDGFAQIAVYAPGVLNATPYLSGEAVTVSGKPGYYLLDAPNVVQVGGITSHLPVVAVRYADNAWFTVRADTDGPDVRAKLTSIANAVQPGSASPQRFPIQFGALPAGLRPCLAVDGLDDPRVSAYPWDASLGLCDDRPGPGTQWPNGRFEDPGVAIMVMMGEDLTLYGPTGSQTTSFTPTEARANYGDFAVRFEVAANHADRYGEKELRGIVQGITHHSFAAKSTWFSGMDVFATL
ncbi:protein kinase domain-containing protein [Actinokineospora diospyrosa]|uniref:non-specific serine/threonine protein kinase n=1 Tax=Actinokineospora diospyrosa TaxID=103728 RepID=A0ABT1IJ00_9PSEU|nr:NERD domain-containing protein [Actinokineospora diospyrosa]MCP2272634.1 Serine/threonine protein kinase [Actinokineospora diospyrosa]